MPWHEFSIFLILWITYGWTKFLFGDFLEFWIFSFSQVTSSTSSLGSSSSSSVFSRLGEKPTLKRPASSTSGDDDDTDGPPLEYAGILKSLPGKTKTKKAKVSASPTNNSGTLAKKKPGLISGSNSATPTSLKSNGKKHLSCLSVPCTHFNYKGYIRINRIFRPLTYLCHKQGTTLIFKWSTTGLQLCQLCHLHLCRGVRKLLVDCWWSLKMLEDEISKWLSNNNLVTKVVTWLVTLHLGHYWTKWTIRSLIWFIDWSYTYLLTPSARAG